jgi:signal transduction histidine kinase
VCGGANARELAAGEGALELVGCILGTLAAGPGAYHRMQFVDEDDNLSTGRTTNIDHLRGNSNFRLVQLDAADRSLLAPIVAGCDELYHLASYVGVKLASQTSSQTILNNLRAIDNILDLAKMEEGRHELELEPVEVGDLLREIVEAVDHRVHHDGFLIRIEAEDPAPTILLDVESITQATTNLIDNAVRYSGESREVVVHGFSDNTHFNIAVEDFGVGLSADETQRVFERFYRGGDELTRSVKGTGLGLSLVKQIAEAHGGSVAVVSKAGRGSRFSIKLPLKGTTGGNDG